MKRIMRLLPVFACAAALMSTSCSSSGLPTAPSTSTPSPSTPAPTPAPPAPATTKGAVVIEIEPNPVPFNGQPITDSPGCANSKNTWFYDQKLIEQGGVDVIFTSRIDKFDQRVVNSLSNLNIQVPANSQVRIKSRWCSSQAVAHTAQTTFSGIDTKGNPLTVEGPVANLQSP